MRLSLFISVFVHAALLVALLVTADFERPTFHASGAPPKSLQVRTLKAKDFERELRDALETKDTQIVSGDEQTRTDTPGERRGKTLYSRTNNRADFETRAARVGKFKNVLKEGLPDARAPSKPQRAAAPEPKPVESPIAKLFKITPRDMPTPAPGESTGRLRAPASVGPTGEGHSASEDYIRDVAIGANTLLNTREYRFYGFYERIREKLSPRWRENLEGVFDRLFRERRHLSNAEQTTQVQIRLGADGTLVAVRVIGSSGLEELDKAATDAFVKASPFPNPPTEMMSAGLVQLQWDFVVVADENAGMRVQMRRSAW